MKFTVTGARVEIHTEAGKTYPDSLMTAASIGYSELNLGLNNQKLALLGLFCKASIEKQKIVMPRFSLFNPNNKEHPTVEFDAVFDGKTLHRFAEAFALEISPGPPDTTIDGWGCFLEGGGFIGKDARRGLAAINDLVCQFFNHLVPHVINTAAFNVLNDVIFNRLGIRSVIQLRIEKDWIEYSKNHLQSASQPGEDYLPSFLEILEKVKNTPKIPSSMSYVVCDEANLPVPKEHIRQEVQSRFGITLVWKSDVLSQAELSRFSILELALIDFEMSVRAPYFIGLSRSSFSDLALFEAFCRTRKEITTHYIYNLPGNTLGRRTDNASQIVPNLVVNRLFAREALIASDDEDCRWPATLTAHISRFGDFFSEGAGVAGVRGGRLVCGVRGDNEGPLIEGFGLSLGAHVPLSVEYRAMLDDGTWTPWARNGEYVGTRGQARQLRGYSVRLDGPMAGRFECLCVGSFFGHRDLVIVRNGKDCCAPGGAKMEAMQIVFRPALNQWPHLAQINQIGAEMEPAETTIATAAPVEASFVKHLLFGRALTSGQRTDSDPVDTVENVTRLRQAGE